MHVYDESIEVVETPEGTLTTSGDNNETFEATLDSPTEIEPHPKSNDNNSSDEDTSSTDNQEPEVLSTRKSSILVSLFKQSTMKHNQNDNQPQSLVPNVLSIDRPRSFRPPEPIVPESRKDLAKSADQQSDDEDDEEDESEYHHNNPPEIEGRFIGNVDCHPNEYQESSSEESNYSDFLNLEGEDYEDMSYDDLARLMAFESLAEDPEPDLFLPSLPTLSGTSASDEELKNALVKKRWREAILDKKRSQIKIHAKLSCNPGIHRSGYRMYQPDDYEGLNTTPEIKELFEYITMYSAPSSSSQVEVKLKPFIPEFYPSVGDIDAFLKVFHPEIGSDNLGIKVLDEPCAFQSDPSVLDLRLRAMAKQSSARAIVVKKVENVGKNTKIIDNWIKDISELHRAKPSPSIHYSKPMPDVDQLLQEWPPGFEKLLAGTKLPPPELDCDLKTYVDLVCNILDIPVYKSRIQSLHLLATLYLAHKSFGNYAFGGTNEKKKNASGTMMGPDNGILGEHENGVDRLELE